MNPPIRRRLLALDTSLHTGWATVDFTMGKAPEKSFCSGVWHLVGSGPCENARRFHCFMRKLKDALECSTPDYVAYEAIVGGSRAGGNTTLIERGLEAVLLVTCFEYALADQTFALAAGTIKKWALGDGSLTRESKLFMVTQAARRFEDQPLEVHRPTSSKPWCFDDNQCDALWLADLASEVVIRAATEEVSLSDRQSLTSLARRINRSKWKR